MQGLLYGFSIALTPVNLGLALVGAFVGTLVGVLPGIGPIGAMALLMGLTYGLPPVSALIMFAGIYYGSMYGGSTTSILLNIPGEPSSVVTTIDGYQMAKRGRGGAALFIAAVGSFVAGTIGLILLTFMAKFLSQVALKFGPPEYFAIATFGLVALSQLSSEGLLKSLIMVAIGLMLGTIGLDVITGQPRLNFGTLALQKGFDFVPVAMGLFGITEVLETIDQGLSDTQEVIGVRFRELLPNREETRRSIGPSLRASVLGFFVGLIPGPAAVISTFLSYSLERRISKRRHEFGHGAPEGVAGPESANNSAAVGVFVPLLSLGIPFAPPAALLLSAMLIHGVTPGPLLVKERPEIFWGVIASMYIGNVMLLVLNLPLVGLFIRILRAPMKLLMPIILLLCLIGVFAVNSSLADIWIMVACGVAGYGLRRIKFPVAPLVLALVIGPMIEDSLRQSLLLSLGDFRIFLHRPIAVALFLITLGIIALPPLVHKIWKK